MRGRSPFLLLVLVAMAGPCSCSRGQPVEGEPKSLPCEAVRCEEVDPIDSPRHVTGGATVGVSAFGPPCRFEAAWSMGQGGGAAFHETFRAAVGGVFPVRAHVAEVDRCQDMTRRWSGGWMPPWITLGIDARDTGWAAPAPESLLVPLRGEASIDGVVAQGALRTSDAGAAPVVDISVGDASWQLVTVRRELHAGDTFPWGAYDATIVRIVAPDTRFVGWVEVAVVPRDASDAATRAAAARSVGRDAR